MIWAALPVGFVLVLALGWLAIQVVSPANGSFSARLESPESQITAVLTAAMTAAVLVGGATVAVRGGADFSSAGQQRYITAPIVYGGFALIAAASIRHLRGNWPIWLPLLAVLALVSTSLSPATESHYGVGSLLQGLVLLLGTVLLGLCGLLSRTWAEREQKRLLAVFIGGGCGIGVLGLNAGIFSALVTPSAVLAVYLAVRRVRGWPLLAAAGLYILIGSALSNADAIDPSAASTGQLLVASALAVLALVPKRWRLPLVAVGAAVGAISMIGSDVPGLFFGRGVDLEDVTLAQRAYETQAVVSQQAGNPLALLLGGGPGATVDLTDSPDASTLLSSGRVLAAVPSVHLLTSYLILKMGLLGVVWFITFMAAAVVAAVRVFRKDSPNLFDFTLVVLVFCGIVQAVPAASFLFSNPLPALLLGILHVRTSTRIARSKAPSLTARTRAAA